MIAILAIQSIQVVRIYKPYFTRQAKAMIVAGKAKSVSRRGDNADRRVVGETKTVLTDFLLY